MPNKGKYLRVPDLYTVGTELVLRDGNVMWLQVLNPFQHDEARHDAATARARLVLALKEHGSDELTQVRAMYMEEGRAAAVQRLIDVKSSESYLKITHQIRDDPDWVEKREIMERGPELLSRPEEDIERKLLLDVSEQFSGEIAKRFEVEVGYLRSRLDALDEDALWEEYQEWYLDRRGNEVAFAEYRLTEMWYSLRCCDGVKDETGVWRHDACAGHAEQIYSSKKEIRDLPEGLQEQIISTLVDLEMNERDAKNSPRQGNSSESSPLPSAPEASTASTQTGIPDKPLGTSAQPSATP